jgi:sensor histidine kinase YesM
MPRPRYFRRIFALFLAAALVPAAVVSAMYTTLAGTAIRREAENRLEAEASSFASAVASIAITCSHNLGVLASDPFILEALEASGHGDPATVARAYRQVVAVFPRDDSQAEASVLSVDGAFALRLGEQPPDRDMRVYESWGIFRALSLADVAVVPRVAVLSDGSMGAFTVGIAIHDDSGGIRGYALADVRRSAINSAAAASGIPGGASVVFPSGRIIFDQSDPANEGVYIDQVRNPSRILRYATAEASGAGGTFTVRAEIPSGLYDGFDRSARNVALIGLVGAIAIATVLSLRASRSVTKPVLAMAQSMKLVEAGDLSIRIEPEGDDELGDLARSFNTMTQEIDALLKTAVERQELLREAELRALAAQMNPHFLHNTLASIKSLAKLGRAAEVAQVVSRLGKILRSGASRREGATTIGDSLELVRDYLSIEQLRFGERFTFSVDVDKALEAVPLPPLTLEPLAENALTHGLEKKRGPGFLSIRGYVDGYDAVIEFLDNGPGIDPSELSILSAALARAEPPKDSHGMGLLGTNRRIVLEFGSTYGISIHSPGLPLGGPGAGLLVVLRVPLGPAP